MGALKVVNLSYYIYFLMDHPDKNLWGVFKGMAVILEEQGFGDMSVRATGSWT